MSIRTALPRALATACFLLALTPAPIHAQRSEADASPTTRAIPDSSATEVFVLGSIHLSNVADQFEPSMIDSLMTALNAFAPEAIAVERLPGRQVAAMERWGGRLDEVNQRYAGSSLHHGHLVREQTGWTWSEANQRADSLLAMARSDSLPFDAESRLSLIRNLTASYRLASAALQWRHLSPEDRSSQTLLPDTTARWLNSRLDAATETHSIGTRLAHRRGHQRVYPMDYQAEHDLMVEIDSLYGEVMTSIEKKLMSNPTIKRTFSLQKSGLEAGSLLPLYRHMNTEEWGRDRVDVHWKELLRRRTPENVGETRVALYETRNLHMVGQIQRMIAQHPGERVLVIVGASHKPLFDAYLRQMMGVKVVDAEKVLPGM